MSVQQSLMDELEAAVQSGSREKRVNTLRRITDLFLMAPAQLNDDGLVEVLRLRKLLLEKPVLDRSKRRFARRGHFDL